MAHENLTSRTDAKIRYARLHLMELRNCDIAGRGHDFERAHQESFFAQLFGAYAALLQELNEDLGCGLDPESVPLGKMRVAMNAKGPVSEKITALYKLEQDDTTWFSHAKNMRDHTSHISGIPLGMHANGPNAGMVTFKNPKTQVEIPGEYFDNLDKWITEIESLIKRMRI
jgi:hypothetical protein